MKFNKINSIKLLIILGFIIIFVPPLIIQPAFFEFFNLGNKSDIGNTLGGITAPFISSIAAILVFIAFKEQVKANNLIKEQQYFIYIQEQIHRLEDDFLNITEIVFGIERDINDSHKFYQDTVGFENFPITISITDEYINKALYSTTIFQQTFDLINNLEHNKSFLNKKLSTLYNFMYKDKYRILRFELNEIKKFKIESRILILELLSGLENLENIFE